MIKIRSSSSHEEQRSKKESGLHYSAACRNGDRTLQPSRRLGRILRRLLGDLASPLALTSDGRKRIRDLLASSLLLLETFTDLSNEIVRRLGCRLWRFLSEQSADRPMESRSQHPLHKTIHLDYQPFFALDLLHSDNKRQKVVYKETEKNSKKEHSCQCYARSPRFHQPMPLGGLGDGDCLSSLVLPGAICLISLVTDCK